MKRIPLKIVSLIHLALGIFSCAPEEKTVFVNNISLNPTSATIEEGETLVITPILNPDNATNKDIGWLSGDTSVALVDEGAVRGVSAGKTVILAVSKDGGHSASCVIVVKEPRAVKTIGVEGVSAISASLKGYANPGKQVASDWAFGFQYSKTADIQLSNSEKVEVKVEDAGYKYEAFILGLTPKTTYYYRSYIHQDGKDSYGETRSFTTKEIGSLITTIDANPIEDESAKLNAQLDLTAIQYNEVEYGFYWGNEQDALTNHLPSTDYEYNKFSASVTHLSQKTKYWYRAYVELDNLIIYGDIKSFTTTVSVESISLDKDASAINEIGGSLTLSATILPENATNKGVEWSSSDESVAMVDADGKVTAMGNGSAIITVTTVDQRKTASCAIVVAQQVNEITLNKTAISLNEGNTEDLVATIAPDNAYNKGVEWTSSDESVVMVNAVGKVTAVSKGAATVFASALDGSGKTATCSVTVYKPVSSISLNKSSCVLFVGQSESLIANVLPNDADNSSVTWSCSNESVATVSNTGVVTGLASGEAIVSVSSRDGSDISATCRVIVGQQVTGITISSSLALCVGESAVLECSVTPDNVINASVNWSSSDNAVVEINDMGIASAISKGKAIITAEAADGSGISAICNVIVSSACPVGAVDVGMKTEEGYVLYWATCNLSDSGLVSSPEVLGDYYSWGDTQSGDNPSGGYLWYRWGISSYSPYIIKYNLEEKHGPVDNLVVLEKEDDAATQILGDHWRMPTTSEWKRLMNQFRWLPDTRNGVKGVSLYDFGEIMFFPVAGSKSDGTYYEGGAICRYWSSTLGTNDSTRAFCVYYDTSSGNYSKKMYEEQRYHGLAIRPVYE